MSVNKGLRVLNRLGAHELTAEEMERIKGGFIPTLLSVIVTGTASAPDHRLDS